MKLVMLPGLDGTGLLFNGFIKEYHGDTEIISLPAFGAQDHRTLAKAILKRLPDEPFVLLAESFSGRVAAYLLEARPDYLRGVIFVASFLMPPNRALLLLAQILPLKTLARLPFVCFLHKHLFLGKAASNDLLKEFVQVIEGIPDQLLKQRIREMGRMVLPVDKSAVPMYYIQAARDRLINKRHWLAFMQVFDDARLCRLQGPHFILQAEPRAAAKLVSQAVLDFQNKYGLTGIEP